jgi:hypothetical protein
LFEYVARNLTEATPTQLSEAIAFAAEQTITEEKERELNWFDACESVIRPLRQKTYLKYLENGCAPQQEPLPSLSTSLSSSPTASKETLLR